MKMLIEYPNSGCSSSDRFIPRRSDANFSLSYYYLNECSDDTKCNTITPVESGWFINPPKYYYNICQYRSELWKAMMPKKGKILTFSSPKKKRENSKPDNQSRIVWPLYPRSKPLLEPPSIILDMPDLDTDIRHQVVDWGKKGHIGTIYEGEVHLWHPEETTIRHVTNTYRRVQSCLKWNPDGTQFAMALDASEIATWDCKTCKTVTFNSCKCIYQFCVVTAMEFTSKNYLLTGCSRGGLSSWDPNLLFIQSCSTAHMTEIINIKVSCNENYVVTTGMDRKVKIWSWPELDVFFMISFIGGPVKALAWHPWRDPLLAVGGPESSALWNVNTLKQLDCKKHPRPNSIIDSMTFNPLSAELVASYYTFGTTDEDEVGTHYLSVLKDLETIIDEGQFHEGRVPYLLWDSVGTKLATASADENLCIWNFFGASTSTEKKYLKLSKNKKFLTSNMFKNLNLFNSCIR